MNAVPPIICCVTLGKTNGEFEKNIIKLNKKINIIEGKDYFYFT